MKIFISRFNLVCQSWASVYVEKREMGEAGKRMVKKIN